MSSADVATDRMSGPAGTTVKGPPTLLGLQCGRAVAALMVVVFHANAFLLPTNFYAGADAGAGWNFGYAGVEFFFVLSGFIMVLVHRADFGRPKRAPRFLWKRVMRIYPIYWIVMIGLVAIYFASPGRGPDHARDPDAILASFLLWPTAEGPIMQVAWTLQHEMLFYLVFATLLLNFRVGLGIFAAWMLACILAVPVWTDLGHPMAFLLKPHNLLFLFGILAAYAHERVSPAMARACFWSGTILFLGLGLSETLGGLEPSPALMPLGYGVGAAFAVVGLARGGLPAPKWLVFLGDASYAIYLVHLPAMNVFAVFLKRAGLQDILPPLAMLALVTGLATLAGAILHVFVEKPLIRTLNRRFRIA
ncbi:MAG: acyltransferase [Jannaschia sp.]